MNAKMATTYDKMVFCRSVGWFEAILNNRVTARPLLKFFE